MIHVYGEKTLNITNILIRNFANKKKISFQISEKKTFSNRSADHNVKIIINSYQPYNNEKLSSSFFFLGEGFVTNSKSRL